MESENYNRNKPAVSRRGGDAKRAATAVSIPAAPASGRAVSPPMGRGGSHKKREDHIEMRPLLRGATSEESTSPISASSNVTSPKNLQSFADSWLGSYVKLKTKEAEKHAYNIKARWKSKKGLLLFDSPPVLGRRVGWQVGHVLLTA